MTKQQQVSKILVDFYRKPIAQVSMELFLSIGAVLFFTIFAIQPTLVTMSDLIAELEEKRNLDQQLSQKVAALSTAQTMYLQVESRIPVLYEAIPTSPQIKEALLILEKVASDRALVIENLTIREVPQEIEADVARPSTVRTSIPVTLSINGTYPNISGYIEDIMSLRRTFIVESITFSRTDERGLESLRANITLSLPFYTDENRISENEERVVETPTVLQDVEL